MEFKFSSDFLSKTTQRRAAGLVVAVAVIAFFALCPPFQGLAESLAKRENGNPEAAMASIGIFLGAIVLFVAQVAPLAVSCLTLMVLLPYFEITALGNVWADFGGTSFFFVLFCFGITGALSRTTLPMRVSATITRMSRGNPKMIVYGFGFAACIFSGFLSNFGTLIMFYSIILAFLKACDLKPGESRLGKCLMIVLPAAAGTGGFISPAGSPGNLIAQSILLQQGIDLKFLHWFLIATPFSLLIIFFLCFCLCALFKPEPLPEEAERMIMEKHAEAGPMSVKEKIACTVIAITISLWFSSTWFPALNTTVVAACAFFVMFMPGVDLMNWKAYVQEADWNLLLMVGSVAVTMGCVNTTGAMGWIMNSLFSHIDKLSVFSLFLIVGLIIAALRVTIPTAPSVAAIFAPVLVGIATVTGGNMTALVLLPVFWSGATMLLVFTEPIFLYTYSAGYYRAGDLFRAGIIPTLLMVVIMAALFPACVSFFGYR
ncbi:MAG: anion permease [Synergistaceae bacterium]|jgi:sodium-dependent dicarboxylate transporter 2/3/5|nr:anion permease [Synergistaceae bacterium]